MINFGLKEPRKIKEVKENYDFPVITLNPTNEKGKSSKIVFNKACYDQMKFDDNTMVVFGRNEDGDPIFIDGKNLPECQDGLKRKLTKANHDIATKNDCQQLIEMFPAIEDDEVKELKVEISYSSELEVQVGSIKLMPFINEEDLVVETKIDNTNWGSGNVDFEISSPGIDSNSESIKD